MRNLKKFLALMLAMVMAMSLMITANATSTAESFADGSGITPEFAEAVDVLSGMRVFSGDNGNFKPASNITRAEMAAVLYRLVSGDVTDAQAGLYANYAPFKDVTADKWYAGYVGYCWNAGLIKGRDAANTIFDPTGNVTGYEALTMLLRAIGYDKNNEFTGPNWQVNVSSQSRDLGILRDVNTTQYGGTLHLAARRDVIASLTFNAAARVPTVTFNGTTYNPYVGVPVTGAGSQPEHNPTLGWKAFGLMSDTGIVVGNQDTGESVTRMSFSLLTADPVYAYSEEAVNEELYDATADATANGTNGILGNIIGGGAGLGDPTLRQNNAIVTFDAKTGLDLFAHKVEIWFDGRQTELKSAYFGQNVPLDWRSSKQNNNLHTYAYFDRSTLTDVVKIDKGDNNVSNNYLDVTTAPNGTIDAVGKFKQNLNSLAKGAGFIVAGPVEQNYAFQRFLPVADTTDKNGNTEHTKVATIGASFAAPDNDQDALDADFSENLYLLISNSDNKKLDVVISLNIQATAISGVDDVNTVKTVTLPQITTRDTFIDPTNEISVSNVPHPGTIEQAQLSPDSAKTLGTKVIGVHVEGTGGTVPLPASASTAAQGGYAPIRLTQRNTTTPTEEDAWFKLIPVVNTKVGQVVSYNPDTGKINLQDGTVLDRSILYYSVVPNTIPQVADKDENIYQTGTYEFYLTPDNKYLGAKLVYGDSFLYGTYLDYSTVTSSSKFEYFLTGVNLAGEKVTKSVSTLINDSVSGRINGTDRIGVPYRDTYGSNTGTDGTTAVNGIGRGVYRGFAYNGTDTISWDYEDLANIGIIAGDNGYGRTGWEDNAWDTWGPTDHDDQPMVDFIGNDKDILEGDSKPTTIDIGSRQMALGAVYAGDIYMNGTANGADSEYLYFTENTKFIVVSGYGEDSLTPVVYNGITDLATRNGHTGVTIDMDKVTTNWGMDRANPAAVQVRDMAYLTQSPFTYSQDRVLSRQADVIFLHRQALTWSDGSSIRYVGNATRTLIDVDNDATQFTMYNNGVAESVWVEGMIDELNTSANVIDTRGHDHFYDLQATGGKAADGGDIYRIVTLDTDGTTKIPCNLEWTANIYTASTMNAQTGSFKCTTGANGRTDGDIDLMRVDKANITNLNTLNANPTWPGINSLTTLNYAGSLGDYTGSQHGGQTDLYVSAITNSSTNVTQIYVCFDQTARP